jgi:hypothetical protein
MYFYFKYFHSILLFDVLLKNMKTENFLRLLEIIPLQKQGLTKYHFGALWLLVFLSLLLYDNTISHLYSDPWHSWVAS